MSDILLNIVSKIAKINISNIVLDGSLAENGIDSINMLVLREEVEGKYNIYISDSDWAIVKSVNDLYRCLRTHGIDETSRVVVQINPLDRPDNYGVVVDNNGTLSTDLEIGMPLTGRNNLAEGPFLQQLGHIRWAHMCNITKVKSKNVVDEQGNRLYPTFFYVELDFSENQPMACFGENDVFRIHGDIKRYGTSILDGTYFLVPKGSNKVDRFDILTKESALKKDIPVVRLSNVFVMQFSGAEWLRKSRPANPGFEHIKEIVEPPDSYAKMKAAEQSGSFCEIPAEYYLITKEPVVVDYQLIPDRDLNGAGLVYFANYPVFLDICERKVLENCTIPLCDDFINMRTLVSRKSAYLNNASAKDVLKIEVMIALRNPYLIQTGNPEAESVQFIVNSRMYRGSDGRLMMVSTAKKTIYNKSIGDFEYLVDALSKGGCQFL
jgi:probable biosynthetic protein (TIGR04098 family)